MVPSKSLLLLYGKIYKKYRTINSILTIGFDEVWRRISVLKIKSIVKDRDVRVLDCACGCGDMTYHLKKVLNKATIYAVDGNERMLEIAKKRVPGVVFVLSNCVELPFPEGFFDIVVVSFATRNLYYSDVGEGIFLEIARVLKKDGIFVSLETSFPDNFLLSLLFRVYLSFIFSILFIFMSKDEKGAYLFLKNSILKFKSKDLTSRISSLFTLKKEIKLFPYVVSLCVFIKRTSQVYD